MAVSTTTTTNKKIDAEYISSLDSLDIKTKDYPYSPNCIVKFQENSKKNIIIFFTTEATASSVTELEKFLNLKNNIVHSKIKISKLIFEAVKNKTKDGTIGDRKKAKEKENTIIADLFNELIESKSSDLHIKVNVDKNITDIKFRTNKIIRPYFDSDAKMGESLIQSLFVQTKVPFSKNMANRANFIFEYNGDVANYTKQKFTVRLSYVPDVKGMVCICRLRAMREHIPLARAGYSADQLVLIERMVEHHSGIILVTGENNSGKSSTISELLSRVSDEQHFMELGDPIETHIDEITQVELTREGEKEDAEKYRKSIMHAVVQSDLDGLAITEIRNAEMANVAVDNAILGQLLMSTMHVSSVIEALVRLRRMGVDQDLIQSGNLIVGIVNQNLVPVICPKCRLDKHIDASKNQRYLKVLCGGDEKKFQKIKFRNLAGCENCKNTGVIKQTLIAEVLYCNHKVKKILREKDYLIRLKNYMWERGDNDTNIATKHMHAIRKIFNGQLDPSDVEKRINPFDEENTRIC